MAELQHELDKMSGLFAPLQSDSDSNKPELARVDESYHCDTFDSRFRMQIFTAECACVRLCTKC